MTARRCTVFGILVAPLLTILVASLGFADVGFQRRDKVTVVDSRDKIIGTVLGFVNTNGGGFVPTVVIAVGGQAAVVGVGRDLFLGTLSTNIAYWQSDDCSGAPVFNVGQLGDPKHAAPAGLLSFVSGNKVSVLPADPPHLLAVTVRSLLDADSVFDGASSAGVCIPLGDPMVLPEAVQGRFVGDMSKYFVGPFRIR